jgi:hypothetical protein
MITLDPPSWVLGNAANTHSIHRPKNLSAVLISECKALIVFSFVKLVTRY